MEPPICSVCDLDFRETYERDGPETGGLVSFAPGPDHVPLVGEGHPDNEAWFCKDHWAAAQRLQQLTLREALARLRGPGAE